MLSVMYGISWRYEGIMSGVDIVVHATFKSIEYSFSRTPNQR
jgi:hypothetical protein